MVSGAASGRGRESTRPSGSWAGRAAAWLAVVRRWHRRLHRGFYDGPAALGWPGRRIRGYRSPTVMLVIWLRGWLLRFFTPAGATLFPASGLFCMAGLLSELMPIFMLSFAMIGLFAADVVAGWWWRPRLRVERRVARRCAAGQEFEVACVVENVGRRPAWDVCVEALPLPSGLVWARPRPAVSEVLPGGSVRVTCRWRTTARGVVALPLPLADSAFPFGLWRWGCLGAPTRPLLVHPAYRQLEQLALPPGDQYHAAGDTPMMTPGDSMHFLACREYRYGDNPRHLHARSSARIGEPVVKEFSREHRKRVALLVDTCSPPAERLSAAFAALFGKPVAVPLEAGLSLAAAVADFLLHHGYRVDCRTPANGTDCVIEGGGIDALEAILDHFAGVTPAASAGFPALVDEPLFELTGSSAAVMVLLRWDGSRQRWRRRLEEAGLAVRTVMISAESADLPGDILQLSPAAVLDGQVRDLVWNG